MGRVAPDRQRKRVDRRLHFVRAWLDTLPAGGWSGTPTALAAELHELAAAFPFYCAVPESRGVLMYFAAHAEVLAAAGWAVAATRTGRARTITFRRVERGRKP